MTPEQIAKGLTKAQRAAVMWLPDYGSWKDHRRKAGANDRVSQTSLSVLEKRIVGDPRKGASTIFSLIEHQFNKGEKERGQMWANTIYRLTPLGLAVRAILEKQDD